MTRRKQSQGTCVFCQKYLTRSGMAKHLTTCPARQRAIAQAATKAGTEQPLYHLQVQDAYSGSFWLHLEVNGTTQLLHLDKYLRAIWLECCGHLSQFSSGGWRGDELSMRRKTAEVFTPGTVLTHIYDFGTSSETLIKLIGIRTGSPLSKHSILLMARNSKPEEACMECAQKAEYVCIECVYEDNATGLLCQLHADTHPHDNYGDPMPLVNSPRVGMCGYEGPAEPPY